MALMGGGCPGVSSENEASMAETGDGPGAIAIVSRVVGALPAAADIRVVPTPPEHWPPSGHCTGADVPTQYTVPARTSSAVAKGPLGQSSGSVCVCAASVFRPDAIVVTGPPPTGMLEIVPCPMSAQ